MAGHDQELLNWMLKSTNPCIQYQIQRDFMQIQNTNQLDELWEECLQNPMVTFWLNLNSYALTHGSKIDAFENLIPKLYQLGFSKNNPDFNDRYEMWHNKIDLSIYKKKNPNPIENTYWTNFGYFENAILAGLLAYSGILPSKNVEFVILQRIQAIFSFLNRKDLSLAEFLVPAEDYPKLPQSRKEHIINPLFYNSGNFSLPWIYDLYGFSRFIEFTKDPELKNQVERIVSLILSPEYQSLPQGFGTVLSKPNYGYALGWKVQLPGFVKSQSEYPKSKSGNLKSTSRFFEMNEIQKETTKTSNILLLLEALSHFETARKHEWFKSAINYLESYRTINNTYKFPVHLLDEKKMGYWNSGAYMGVGESRANLNWREIESSYWMLKIKKNT